MRIVIDINTDNAAVADDFAGEVRAALSKVAERVIDGAPNGFVRDVNGAHSTAWTREGV